MIKHLNLAYEDLIWLQLLSNTTTNKQIINFIVNLDDTYKGADSYLSFNELPGCCLTDALVSCGNAHPKMQLKAFRRLLGDMPFFKIGLRLVGLDHEKWNPANETIKAFVTRHVQDEVIYFEDQESYKTVSYFQNKFSKFTSFI